MSFHLFHISEAYSSADGSIQFIEFHGEANSQHLWDPYTLTVTQGGTVHSFSIPSNLPSSSTLNKNVLVATQAFADLTGITPDYIIPENFLFTTGSATINFPGMDSLSYTALPTDGVHSLGEDGTTEQINSPTNFAGQTFTISSALAPILDDSLEDVLAGNADGFEFVVPAATFIDITNDALTYAVTFLNGDPLPGWLAFDSGTRTFSFTAGTATPGILDVKVTASDTLGGSASDTFALQVISGSVLVGTASNETLNGTADDDHITALGGDDSLAAGAGDDTMLGGSGNDTFAVDTWDDVVTEVDGQGDFDRVVSSTSLTLPVHVEQLLLTGIGDWVGIGNILPNVLIGNSGDNSLYGAGGDDSLYGENGNDSFMISGGDIVVEGDGMGNDRVLTATTLGPLFDFVEELVLLTDGNLNATGNALTNTLIGNDGNNVLNGGAEGDAMIGGLGNDTYHVDDADDTVSETGAGTDEVQSAVSFSLVVGDGDVLPGDVERLVLTGSGDINGTGNALANAISGNSGHNVVNGGAGDDSINAGVGDDTVDGGAGDDTLKGSTGEDVFLFADLAGTDELSDFTSGVDQIHLDDAVFSALTEGTLGAANAQFGLRSAIGETSGDADDYVKYATDTGELFYDANGSAAGGLTAIALLDASCGATLPQLALADIVVI